MEKIAVNYFSVIGCLTAHPLKLKCFMQQEKKISNLLSTSTENKYFSTQEMTYIHINIVQLGANSKVIR
jgi:hypothetical protein